MLGEGALRRLELENNNLFFDSIPPDPVEPSADPQKRIGDRDLHGERHNVLLLEDLKDVRDPPVLVAGCAQLGFSLDDPLEEGIAKSGAGVSPALRIGCREFRTCRSGVRARSTSGCRQKWTGLP